MNRALLVTMAGTATRFRATVGRDVLKCLYSEGSEGDSLLHFYGRIAQAGGFAVVRFVGGYRFDDLTTAARAPAFRALTAGIDFACIDNPEFESKGSGASLARGLRAILDDPACAAVEEIVFMEGDLAFDLGTLMRLLAEPGDALTTCREPITAQRSVCVYRTPGDEVRFVYDPAHQALAIPEPFQAIYNSGQVWKFADLPRLDRVLRALTPEEDSGTNLGIVQNYFRGRPRPAVHTFEDWINCNTLDDYRAAQALLQRSVSPC